MSGPGLRLSACILLCAVLLVACSPAAAPTRREAPAAPTQAPAAREVAKTVEVLKEGQTVVITAAAPPAASTAVAYEPANVRPAGGAAASRMIIKNGEITLLVQDTDVAIDLLTQVVDDLNGYIVTSRIWFQESYDKNYKYASFTIGVPSDQFEQALRRLRQISIRVLDENATGEDVTDEYVDLQSKLENLQATRDRIRQFLDQAKTVEEALKVNEQLSKVEAEINQVQGRMNYLFDRSAFSLINISLEPDITAPTPTLTLTPTMTSTPTPTATPTPWNPGNTARQAAKTLGTVSQTLVELALWVVILFLPIVLVLALIIGIPVWLARRLRRPKSPTPSAQPASSTPPTPVETDQAPKE
jgi:hypothetical protein